MSRRIQNDDIGWQYGIVVDNNRHFFKCNYCGHLGREGGVSRLKKYLAGGRIAGYNEIHPCKNVPKDIKILMSQHLKEAKIERQRKKIEKDAVERRLTGRRTLNLDENEVWTSSESDCDVQKVREEIPNCVTRQSMHESRAKI